jgi:hypothetical protein
MFSLASGAVRRVGFLCFLAAACGSTTNDARQGEGKSGIGAPPVALLSVGAYLMALTDGTDARDYVIVPDSVDENGVTRNGLDAVAPGQSVVAPPDPRYRTHGDVLERAAACGYAAMLNGRPPGDDPCFEDAASAVVPIRTTSESGQALGGNMTWNGVGFVRRALKSPQHVVVPTSGLGQVGLKVVETEHVGLGVAIPKTPAGDVSMSNDVEFGIIDVSGAKLWNADGVSLTLSSARIATRPHLETALGMQGGAIEHLEVLLDDTLDVELAVTLAASASYEKHIDEDVFVVSKTLPPQIVGGVPLVETLRFALHAHCHVSLSTSTSVTAGVALHESLKLGFEYRANRGWSNLSGVARPKVTPRLSGIETSGSATFECDLTPKFSLLFYDLAGPYVAITPSAAFYVTANTQGLRWQLDADFNGTLGAEANGSLPFMGALMSDAELRGAHLSLFDYHLSSVETGSLQ